MASDPRLSLILGLGQQPMRRISRTPSPSGGLGSLWRHFPSSWISGVGWVCRCIHSPSRASVWGRRLRWIPLGTMRFTAGPGPGTSSVMTMFRTSWWLSFGRRGDCGGEGGVGLLPGCYLPPPQTPQTS